MDQADKERLDKLVERMAYVNASGGMAGYQQLAQAEMMMGAAEGMKKGGDGGGAFQGAGIGMGFAMAGQMAGMMGNANAQRPQPPGETRDADHVDAQAARRAQGRRHPHRRRVRGEEERAAREAVVERRRDVSPR